ncbi:hypothetical protein Nepgr_004962 [Nepenthes gracilis]|uniref:NAC domain-containing protein n=1 Tax=Nepenthes gracilis TaxID=150966 RepID=A0AAD3S288_NEPGR|nr:hypothetical protein Nepgr_004962 [Nepenthes gracilis]
MYDSMGDSNFNLPPGFRFDPTDEELVLHFLHRKAARLPCHPDVIPDLDLFPHNPWELQGKALSEGSKWYYYSRRAPNRSTGSGYWKQLVTDEPIISSANNKKIGLRNEYVFCVGEPPHGACTTWIMHEYRLSAAATRSSSRAGRSKLDHKRWALYKVYEQTSDDTSDDDSSIELSCLDEVFLSMDDLDEVSFP